MSNYLSCNWEYAEIEKNLENLLHSNINQNIIVCNNT